MATQKEIKEHLKIALEEVGEINPWFEKNVNTWIFEHPKYPVGCEGNSKEEVIKKYPLYLKEFIDERLKKNISPSVEIRTTGKGGKREGAGRPINPNKEKKVRTYLPEDIANLLKEPGVLMYLRGLIQACHHTHA
jgi:hypothetical protein